MTRLCRWTCGLTAWLLLSLSLSAAPASANRLMIWPIHPVIQADTSATGLWLENRGDAPTLIQVRIFAWQQREGDNQYQAQNDLISSTPMVEIAPGKRQLIRLIRRTPPPDRTERAWRVILDEVPDRTTESSATEQTRAGIELQMRYSLPLFDYANGAEAEADNADDLAAALRWRVVEEQGKPLLEVENPTDRHARLTDVALMQGGRESVVANGLMGYVLADSYRRWPLESESAAEALRARVNGGEPVRLAR